MVIEPLPAFFILEGIAFDMIGAYLVVSGVFKLNYNMSQELNDIESIIVIKETKIDFLKQKRDLIREEIFEKNLSYNQNEKLQLKLQDLQKKINDSMLELEPLLSKMRYLMNIDYLKMKDKQTNEKAIKGLFFLIGGFLLQGIGVIIQL